MSLDRRQWQLSCGQNNIIVRRDVTEDERSRRRAEQTGGAALCWAEAAQRYKHTQLVLMIHVNECPVTSPVTCAGLITMETKQQERRGCCRNVTTDTRVKVRTFSSHFLLCQSAPLPRPLQQGS